MNEFEAIAVNGLSRELELLETYGSVQEAIEDVSNHAWEFDQDQQYETSYIVQAGSNIVAVGHFLRTDLGKWAHLRWSLMDGTVQTFARLPYGRTYRAVAI